MDDTLIGVPPVEPNLPWGQSSKIDFGFITVGYSLAG
jgi:hypothetical protein